MSSEAEPSYDNYVFIAELAKINSLETIFESKPSLLEYFIRDFPDLSPILTKLTSVKGLRKAVCARKETQRVSDRRRRYW